jgi:hypothetical protein
LLRAELATVTGWIEEAERLGLQAIEIYDRLPYPQGVAKGRLFLATLALASGDLAEANHLNTEALAGYEKVGYVRGIASCLLLAVRLALALGRTQDAVRLLQETRTRFAELHDPMEAWCLHLLADLATDIPDHELAASLSAEGVAVLERVRSSLRSELARIAHGERWEPMYEAAIRHALDADLEEQAFELACRYLGRLVYEEQLGAAEPSEALRSYLAGERLAEWDRLSGERERTRSAYERVLAAALERAKANPTPGESGDDDPELAAQAAAATDPTSIAWLVADAAWWSLYEEVRVEIGSRRAPEIAPFDLPSLEAAVGRRGVALVLLLWRRNLALGFVLAPSGKLSLHRYDDDDVAAIDEAVTAWRTDAGRSPAERNVVGEAVFAEHLEQLEVRLWAPLEPAIGGRPVRLVPDAALGSVPFAAITRSALRILPGAGLLLTEPEPNDGDDLVALGADPAGELAGIELCLALTETAGGRVVRGSADPARFLLADTGQHRLLALLGHMDLASDPGHASVRLAAQRPDGKGLERRDLSALELLRLRCRATDVLLLGCASAASADGGTELLSIAGALLASTGARAVLASCVPVSELAATLLYVELLGPLSRGELLDDALGAALERLADLRLTTLDAYLDGLIRIQPALRNLKVAELSFAAWVRAQIAASGAHARGSQPLLTLPDRAAWTILGR